MLELLVYIIVAIVIALIIFYTRRNFSHFNEPEQIFYTNIFGWFIIVFALLLTFTVSSFYQDFINIQEAFIIDCTNITMIYRVIKLGPQNKASRRALRSIELYVESVINDTLPALQQEEYSPISEELYRKMDYDIIEYVYSVDNLDDNPQLTDILSRLSTDQRIKKLSNGIKDGQFLINILLFISFFVFVGSWFVKLENKYIQLVLDLFLAIIIFVCIYLLEILNNPFIESPISINLSIYSDLLHEIQHNKRYEP